MSTLPLYCHDKGCLPGTREDPGRRLSRSKSVSRNNLSPEVSRHHQIENHEFRFRIPLSPPTFARLHCERATVGKPSSELPDTRRLSAEAAKPRRRTVCAHPRPVRTRISVVGQFAFVFTRSSMVTKIQNISVRVLDCESTLALVPVFEWLKKRDIAG